MFQEFIYVIYDTLPYLFIYFYMRARAERSKKHHLLFIIPFLCSATFFLKHDCFFIK